MKYLIALILLGGCTAKYLECPEGQLVREVAGEMKCVEGFRCELFKTGTVSVAHFMAKGEEKQCEFEQGLERDKENCRKKCAPYFIADFRGHGCVCDMTKKRMKGAAK